MAKETVQAVRLAELEAARKEQEALKRRDTIILEAEQSAKEIVNSIAQQALDKAEQRKTAAMKAGMDLLATAKVKSEQEVLIMKELALRKEEEAIRMILASVLHAS
jgi:V/A-type H+/Na+-transporting ATPase subunit G/H